MYKTILIPLNTFIHAETNKNPHPASQLHADQTNNKLYLYEKTNTTNKLLYDDYYQGDFWKYYIFVKYL